MPKGTTPLAPMRPGRPVVHTAPWERITVIMLDRQAAYLDVMSILIRMKHHKVLSRAAIIRAFVEFMERSEIDFTEFATADAMVGYLTAHLRRNPNRGGLPLLLESNLLHPERSGAYREHEEQPVESRS